MTVLTLPIAAILLWSQTPKEVEFPAQDMPIPFIEQAAYSALTVGVERGRQEQPVFRSREGSNFVLPFDVDEVEVIDSKFAPPGTVLKVLTPRRQMRPVVHIAIGQKILLIASR